MKKSLILAVAAIAMASCSSDELVSKPTTGETPIAFSVEKANITRGAQNLEATGHYNFGVWAFKYKDGLTTQKVMDNYLVGYSNGNNLGYDKTNSTTWASSAGSETDHTSPWFYEYLGTDEYKYNGDAGFYKNTDANYMSAKKNQYLRYWDLKYATTNFYAYAPYKASGVTFDESTKKITVDHTAQKAGYNDASLDEFMYAGATATNADKKDVTLKFKHLGAQVNLRFYEDVRGYKVELIDVTTDGTGIQATPATKSGTTTYTYTKADYYTECGATIDFNTVTTPTATVNHTDAVTTQENLKFTIPGTSDGLTTYNAVGGKSYNIIPEKSGDTQTSFASSPTTYYPVAQGDSKVGFTFHVSYKLIAEDNGEEITVNDARVYVPAKDDSGNYIAAWQPNTKYTYTFKITKDSTGSTDTNTPNIEDPTVPSTPQVYPIVFDGATIEDYTENVSNY